MLGGSIVFALNISLKGREKRAGIETGNHLLSKYLMIQKLKGAPRLLFGNGCVLLDNEALPGVMGTGEQGHLFQGNREQRPIFQGNRGTKTILGNREHRKQIFDFLGTREQANLFQGEKGTCTPPGRASIIILN